MPGELNAVGHKHSQPAPRGNPHPRVLESSSRLYEPRTSEPAPSFDIGPLHAFDNHKIQRRRPRGRCQKPGPSIRESVLIREKKTVKKNSGERAQMCDERPKQSTLAWGSGCAPVLQGEVTTTRNDQQNCVTRRLGPNVPSCLQWTGRVLIERYSIIGHPGKRVLILCIRLADAPPRFAGRLGAWKLVDPQLMALGLAIQRMVIVPISLLAPLDSSNVFPPDVPAIRSPRNKRPRCRISFGEMSRPGALRPAGE